jgi:hypothetical protein
LIIEFALTVSSTRMIVSTSSYGCDGLIRIALGREPAE